MGTSIKCWSRALVVVALGFYLPATGLQAQDRASGGIETDVIFDGAVDVVGPRLALGSVNLKVQNWTIENRQSISLAQMDRSLAAGGMLIVQLLIGEAVSVVDGKRQPRQEGEFWVVPSGSSFTLEIGNDTVLLHTIQVSP